MQEGKTYISPRHSTRGGFLILYIWFSNRSYYLPNPSVCILLSVSTQYYYLLINIATNHRLAHSFRSIQDSKERLSDSYGFFRKMHLGVDICLCCKRADASYRDDVGKPAVN